VTVPKISSPDGDRWGDHVRTAATYVEVIATAGDQVLVVSRAPRRAVAAPKSGRQGPSHGGAVSGKLAAGARVVTRGNERLRPGQPVRVSGGARASASR